jgi:hypothetical protein
MLVDIVVAAMPYFPALPQEPGRDFTPVRLKGRSRDGGRSAAVRKYMRISRHRPVLQALPPGPTAPLRSYAQIWRLSFSPRAPEADRHGSLP